MPWTEVKAVVRTNTLVERVPKLTLPVHFVKPFVHLEHYAILCIRSQIVLVTTLKIHFEHHCQGVSGNREEHERQSVTPTQGEAAPMQRCKFTAN